MNKLQMIMALLAVPIAFFLCSIIPLVVKIIPMIIKNSRPEAQAQMKAALEKAIPEAAKGDAEAQTKLGLAFDGGIGMRKNNEEAYFWLSLSVNSYSGWDLEMVKMVSSFRDKAGQSLNANQRAAIDKRVKEWKPNSYFASSNDLLP